MSAYERFAVDAVPETGVSALRGGLHERGFAEYAVVNHGRDMAAAGQPRFVAWTLILGNPAAGAALLARGLAAAVDIPLRLAIIATERGANEMCFATCVRCSPMTSRTLQRRSRQRCERCPNQPTTALMPVGGEPAAAGPASLRATRHSSDEVAS
jgi:hypothetical protein